MNKNLGLIACSLFLLALTACGGAGGGDGSSAAPPPNGKTNAGGGGSPSSQNNPFSPSTPTSGTSTDALRFAYVSTRQGIFSYSIDTDNGRLSEIAGSPFAASSILAVDPSGKFAYGTSSEGVSVYSIDAATGALSEISGSPFSAGSTPRAIAVHPSGKFIYVFTSGLGDIWAYAVAPTGELSQVEGSPYSVGTVITSIAFEPSGKYVYVPECRARGVYAFQIDPASGVLTKIDAGTSTGRFACDIDIDPSGRFAYIASNGDGDPASSGIWAYTIDLATGSLTHIGSFAVGSGALSVAVHPNGKFAYVTGRLLDGLRVFPIDATGGFVGPGAPAEGGGSPLTIDAAGRFAYSTGAEADNIAGFTIDSDTGTFTEIAGSPLGTGAGPGVMIIASIP